MRRRGGLKGKMALGDAHPYLALFYLSKFFIEILEMINIIILNLTIFH